MGTPPMDDQAAPEHTLPPHLQHQAGYAHMRHAPSASPPIPNGVPFHHRQQTPQAQMQMGSRPSSRNNVPRPNANLGPSQLSQAPQGPNGYAYMPNPPIYDPRAAQPMPSATSHSLPDPRFHGVTGSQQYTGPPQRHPPNGQVQQTYSQEQRRQSMPPTFPQQEQPRQQHLQPIPSPPQPERIQEEDNQLSAPKPIPAKSRSIFTPIDDSRSLLAQHWSVGDKKDIKPEKENRSQSVDIGNVQTQKPNPLMNNSTSSHTKPAQQTGRAGGGPGGAGWGGAGGGAARLPDPPRARRARRALHFRLRCAICGLEFEDRTEAVLPVCPRCGRPNERVAVDPL